MFLTDLSLKRPVFATMFVLALVALGVLSYISLNINDWPAVEFPYVSVTIVEKGASAAQIDSQIAQRVEDAVGQVPGVKHIYSTSQEGVATVVVEFSLSTNAAVAAQDVRDKLGTIQGQLPQDAETPIIARYNPAEQPVISLALTGDESVRELTTLANDVIVKRLEAVDGVGTVQLSGGEERQINVDLDRGKLAQYGVAPAGVVQGLEEENLKAPAGDVEGNGHQTSLMVTGQVEGVSQLAGLPVANRDGMEVYLGDVARVTDGVKEPDSLARYQGRPAVGLDVMKESGTNTVLVASQVKETLSEIARELPPGVHLKIVRDDSVQIHNFVNDVISTIIEGALLAIVTVFFFLRDWRSTLIAGLSIPSSIIATFFMMRLLGFTVNTMTLMALSLAVGLLIDDAIVVIENIHRHMRMGKSPLAAAREASGEIGLAVMATTFTAVAVFLPVGMMTGVVGQFFKEFGITVVFSVLVSLLVSFTLVPLLSSRYVKGEETGSKGPLGALTYRFNRGFDRLTGYYAAILKSALGRPWLTIGIAALLFAASLLLIPLLGSTFVPAGDTGELYVAATMDSGLSLSAAGRETSQLENILLHYPGVVKVYSVVNNSDANIYVGLVDKSRRRQSIGAIAADLRQKLNAVPGVQVAVNLPGALNTGEKTVQYYLLGDNQDTLATYGQRLQQMMASIPGAVDVGTSYQAGQPQEKLVIRRRAAADLGVSTAAVQDTVNTLFGGVVAGHYRDGADRYDIQARLGDGQRQSPDDLQGIYIPSSHPNTPMIPLSQVTTPVFESSAAEIHRYDRSYDILLSANLDGVSLGGFNNKLTALAKTRLSLPPGYSLVAGGDTEQMQESFSSMGIALITGLLFIFFILASQFESYVDPFAIMLSIPLALVGAVGGLLVMGSDLSLISLIGIIMLMGLVTKNAILLIDFAKQGRAAGMERNQAVLAAARIRIRPIVMTSTAMILSMVPLALGLGAGGETRAPMAQVIIGGLITSSLLTLVVVPVMYVLLDDLQTRLFGRRSAAAPAGPSNPVM